MKTRCTQDEMNDIVDEIMQMDAGNIEQVINAVRGRREMLSIRAKAKFRVGDRVKFFSSKRQEEIVGTVHKINRKKIQVSVGIATWTVPPTMLTLIKGE
jgi:dsDNA-specific endonuclease/ATPase MutS2|tara:strand:- start:154 stop:450 length:297 start_codon:yes stop_codon:yes gene_type:complete